MFDSILHPLSTFPNLFSFSLLSPLILRTSVSFFLFFLGRKRYNKEYGFVSIFYFLFGIFLFLGFYTQISSILSIVIIKLDFYLDYWKDRKTTPVSQEKYFLYGVFVVVLLSLLFSGPGLFALDLPL